MQVDKMDRTRTNTVFKCYVQVPAFLIERVEENGILHEGDKPYVQVRVYGMSITVYEPEAFTVDAIYSVTVNRKKVGEKVYNHLTFGNYEWQNKDGAFAETPPLLDDFAVIAHIVGELSPPGGEFLTPVAVEPTMPVEEVAELEGKVLELPDKFWRFAARQAEGGIYERNGYTVKSIIPPIEAECGIYHVLYSPADRTFTIEPTRNAPTATAVEVADWIKSITGWCGDINRLLG